jgi:hypothetical protein
MFEERWKTDWTEFVEYVAQAIERGETSQSLSTALAAQRVQWKGHVTKLRLDARYAAGVSLQMDEVRRLLRNGYTLIGRHLFLKVQDPEQKERLRHLKVGDQIVFCSTIVAPDAVFDALKLASFDKEKTTYVELSTRGAELVAA